MVLDEVADGLRKCREVKDRAKRAERLKKLAGSRDPRVAIAMAEYIEDPYNGNLDRYAVGAEMARHYLPPVAGAEVSSDYAHAAVRWWKENEADLRRRAKELPP
jgi:hypothetical protein